MTETLSPVLPDEVDAAARGGRDTAHREAHFGDIGRGPVRIECMRVALRMLEEAL